MTIPQIALCEEPQPASVVLLTRRAELFELVLSWPVVIHTPWMRPKGTPPDNDAELWRWIWSGVEIPYQELTAAVGLSPVKVRSLVGVLVAHRLVYPCGVIPDTVSACIAEIATERLRTTGGHVR